MTSLFVEQPAIKANSSIVQNSIKTM